MTTNKGTVSLKTLDIVGSGVLLLLFFLGVLIVYNVTKQDKLEPLILRHEAEVADLNEKIVKLENDRDFYDQYREERCVCMRYGSAVEEPVTKEQICNYKPEEWGHYRSRLESWHEK
jgi:hypothetical protein